MGDYWHCKYLLTKLFKDSADKLMHLFLLNVHDNVQTYICVLIDLFSLGGLLSHLRPCDT